MASHDRPFPLRRARRRPALAPLLMLQLLLLLAACCPGLDARRLERLDYGMDYACVDEVLENDLPGLPVLRFFVADELGVEHDCVVVLHEGERAQPDYLLLSIDGTLQAAIGRRHLQTWWRRPADRCPWSPAQLRAVMQDAVAARVPLAWARLEAHHREIVNPNKRPSARMSDAMVGSAGRVVLAPFVLLTNLITGNVEARDAEVSACLLRVPAHASCDEVRAAIGEPTSAWDECDDSGGSQRLWAYDLGWGRAHSLGFRDGRLLWIELGR